MHDILDLVGGSGATYRFRRWAGDQPHQPIAGSFIIVTEEGGAPQVLVVGETNDLARAVGERAHKIPVGAHIFTRLNVGRAAREAEHADLTAGYPSAKAEQTHA